MDTLSDRLLAVQDALPRVLVDGRYRRAHRALTALSNALTELRPVIADIEVDVALDIELARQRAAMQQARRPALDVEAGGADEDAEEAPEQHEAEREPPERDDDDDHPDGEAA